VSIRAGVRAFPALLKVGFAEAVAYRAELLIWILTSTMPLIMLALWSSVAAEGRVGRFGQEEFTEYFLAAFVVRQLAASWTCWEINYEVRLGKLSMRLLRPVHPVVAYAAEGIAALPLRLVIAIPVAWWALSSVDSNHLPHGTQGWSLFAASVAGAWALTFLVNIAIGSLSFFMESSIKLMDVYLAAYAVFSGYVVPLELFPNGVRAIIDVMPFRYQLGLPVELLSGQHAPTQAIELLIQQWALVAVLALVSHFAWQRGIKHFEAFGG
jgi:ABC-2 type transport system permease protein